MELQQDRGEVLDGNRYHFTVTGRELIQGEAPAELYTDVPLSCEYPVQDTPHPTERSNSVTVRVYQSAGLLWRHILSALVLFAAVGLLIEHFISHTPITDAASQRVRVDPEVQSYPGETVNLRCAFADKGDLQLTQVSWIWERTDGAQDNIAVYHPEFGSRYPQSPFTGRISFPNPSLDNPSVVISDLKMTDEGKYICEFSTYPSVIEQGTTTLIMLDGKPPAQIKWVSGVNANGTTTSKPGADNTVTVCSEYWLVPTPADNGKDISCVISHPTQDKPQTMPLKLAIEYPPKVTIVGYHNNWYVGRTNVMLTCQATGNPVLTSVTWKVLSGRMPDAVQVKENKLMVLKVDEFVNTTFVCEVKNRLGVGKDQVTVVVSAAPGRKRRGSESTGEFVETVC
ncbi:hypothetical protein SKAU_G00225950 [Synaphobranchus kaupii]|uniref:Ig-like domain-containing protein n=1 Tax=Synaphobranchus kaupii TaxID=118154 RepID=A0A9Q1FBP8_SYNKA|nr:hypothetical protein SKAU_G00225950 [Synaphobranchus kaupii]